MAKFLDQAGLLYFKQKLQALMHASIEDKAQDIFTNIENNYVTNTALARELDDLVENSSGLYFTKETQQDGSIITYAHDKPSKSDSDLIIEFGSDAVAVSNDAGKTWPYGFIYTGDAILNKLSAVGIDAGYIRVSSQTLTEFLGDMQDQIDGAIETWTGSVVPTLNNNPAVNWTNDATKNRHIGDIYYYTLNDGTSYAYRFQKVGNVYEWTLIRDTEITKALGDADEALRKATKAQQDITNLDDYVAENVYTKSGVDSLFEVYDGNVKSYMAEAYVAEGTYSSDKAGLEANISTVSESVSSLTQDVNGFKTEVSTGYATKTELSDAESNAAADATSKANKALTDAKTDATSKANKALSDAIADTTNKLASYSTTVEMNSAITQKADEITSTVSSTYVSNATFDTEKTDILDTAAGDATSKANKALTDAKADTTNRLKSYSTTSQMNSAITQKADEITSTVSENYVSNATFDTEKTDILDTAAGDATSKANKALTDAKADTTNRLKSYSTTSQMNSAITQKANEITSTVSENYVSNTTFVTEKTDILDTAAGDATSKANKALTDAKADTDAKLTSYSTTEQMNSAIDQKADSITLAVSKTYATQTSVTEAKEQTITGDTIHYLATSASSGVKTTTSGWTTDPQSVTVSKRYLWTYHTYTYGSGTTKDTTPVITGVYGNTGEQGPQGTAGVGITSVAEKYALNNNSASAPSDSSFSDEVKTPTASQRYLWNYEIITYTNSTTSTTDKKIICIYGQNGTDGRGISSVTNYYLATNEPSGVTTSTSGWTTSMQSVSTSKKYLWNYEKITYTSGDPTTTTPGIIGAYGDTGNSAISYMLMLSDSAILKSAAGALSPTKLTLTAKSKTGTSDIAAYSGRFKIEATEDGSTWEDKYASASNASSYTYTVPSTAKMLRCSLYQAGGTTVLLDQQTIPVVQEAKSITAITEYYAINNSTTAPSASSFTTGVKTPTATNRYLWNMEKISYSDGTSENKDIHIVGMYSEDGNGISSITEYYALGTTTTAPADSEFSTTIKKVTATNKYLWNYEEIAYTSGSVAKTGKRLIGVYGDEAYTVILGNESHTFSAGVSAAIASSVDCSVIAYKGATQVTAKIGSITGAPTGMSTTITDNETTTAKFTVSVTTSLTTKQGMLKVPITVDGKSFTRYFSWALALTGTKGDKGDKGDAGQNGTDGISVVEVIPIYKAYNSETAPAAPTSEVTSTSTNRNIWTKAIPELNATYCYLFTCDQIKYSNSTYTWTTVVLDTNSTSFYSRITAAELKVSDDSIKSLVDSKYANQLAYLRDSSTGLGMRVNATTISNTNNGEIYLHGYDESMAPAAVDGWVWWNGEKVTITKGYWVNPGEVAPYDTTIYHVYRKDEQIHYDVWYEDHNWVGYAYDSSYTPGTIVDYLWSETDDIILLSYVSPGKEAAITGAILFTPPKKASEVTQVSQAISQIVQTENSILSTVQEFIPVTNMLPSVYYTEEVRGTVYTTNGITWTVNSDGTVTATGTATSDSTYNFTGSRASHTIPALKVDPTSLYSISGCPVGGSTSTYYVRATFYTKESYDADDREGTTYASTAADVGAGASTHAYGWEYARMWATIKSGYTCPSGGLTFKPMFERGIYIHDYVSTHGAFSLMGRIAASETSIQQTASSISSIVTSGTVDGTKLVNIINQTPTTTTIAAQHIDLKGSVIISDFTEEAQGIVVTNVQTKNQYYLSTSASSATGGSWQDTVPTWESGKYVWTRVHTTKTFASSTTSSSTSTAVYDKNLTEYLSSLVELSGRTPVVNLLPAVYYSENANGKTRTHYGITWTVNPDGSVTAVGTATGDSLYYISSSSLTNAIPLYKLDPNKRYTISGCPAGGSTSTYFIQAFFYETPGGTYVTATDVGSSRVTGDPHNYVYVRLVIKNGYTTPAEGLTFYPMLEVGTTPHTYVSSHTGAGAYASSLIKATVSVYYRSTSSTNPTIDTSSPIGTALDTDEHWEYPMPRPKKERYFYTCERYTYADGTVGFSAVRKMDYLNYVSMWCSAESAVYFDGGNIAAGTVTADKIDVANLSALNATVGGFDIKEDWLQYGTWGTEGGFIICPRGTTTTKTIGGTSNNGWALAIGDKFGVRNDGSVSISAGSIKMETASTSMDIIKLNYEDTNGNLAYTAMSSGYLMCYDELSGLYSKMFNNGYTVYNTSDALKLQLGVYNMGSSIGYRPALVFNSSDGVIQGASLFKLSTGAEIFNLSRLEIYPTSATANNGGYIDFHFNKTYGGDGDVDYTGRLIGSSSGVAAYPSITNASDRRLKYHIGNLDEDVSEKFLRRLDPVRFEYQSAVGVEHFGFYAQDILSICDELKINTTGLINEAALFAPEDETTYYTLNYNDLIAFLVKGWQSHEAEITRLHSLLERIQNGN